MTGSSWTGTLFGKMKLLWRPWHNLGFTQPRLDWLKAVRTFIYEKFQSILLYIECLKWKSPGRVWLCDQNTGVGSSSFSRGSSQPRDWTQVSRTGGRFFTSWATREAPYSLPFSWIQLPECRLAWQKRIRFRCGNGNPLQDTCLENSMDRGAS